MPRSEALLEVLLRLLASVGLDPTSWVAAWARLLPSLLLIPAFGLPGFPATLRVAFALVLGAVVAPALPPLAVEPSALLATLLAELARGVPVALSAALCIWGAGMAGNLLDELRGGGPRPQPVPGMSDALSPLGTLLTLAACIAFFRLGGPARLALALASAPPFGAQDLPALARALAQGLGFAVVLCGPLLALVPFVELLEGLVARVARPLATGAAFGPLKTLALLGLVGLLLDRIASGVVLWLDAGLPAPPS